MFQWTSITEWLHPAVPPVKTLPFFRKYFHSTIIASICSYTVATLAMSLWLSEFTAERVANVYARVLTCLCVFVCVSPGFGCMHASSSLLRFYQQRGNRDSRMCWVGTMKECDEARQHLCSNSTTHLPTHCLLLLFEGWFNRVDFSWWDVCANTIWLVHPNSQKACEQQN